MAPDLSDTLYFEAIKNRTGILRDQTNKQKITGVGGFYCQDEQTVRYEGMKVTLTQMGAYWMWCATCLLCTRCLLGFTHLFIHSSLTRLLSSGSQYVQNKAATEVHWGYKISAAEKKE